MTSTLVDNILHQLEQSGEFQQLAERLTCLSRGVSVEGVSGAGKALLCAGTAQRADTTVLLVTYNPQRVRSLYNDLKALIDHTSADKRDQRVLTYPSISSALYDGVKPDQQDVADRLTVLERLCARKPTIVVATIQALLHLTMPHDELLQARTEVCVGDRKDRDHIAQSLNNLGYQKVDLVDDVGQYSVRGDIIDVSPPTSPGPVRIESFGDQIEAIRYFDPETQRSTESIDGVAFGPAAEMLLTEKRVKRALPNIKHALGRELDSLNEKGKHREADRLEQRMTQHLQALRDLRPSTELLHYAPFIYEHLESLFDYLPDQARIIVDEPVRLQAHAQQFEDDLHHAYKDGVKLGSLLRLPQTAIMPFEQFVAKYLAASRQPPVVYLTMLQRQVPWAGDTEVVRFHTPPVDSFGGKFDLLVAGIDEWQKDGKSVVVCASDVPKTVRVLKQRGLDRVVGSNDTTQLQPSTVVVADMDLSAGFAVKSADLVVLTAKEIYGWRKLRRAPKSTYRPGFSLVSLRELNENDPVVHINHGVGIYRGLARQTVDNIERDYLVIEYADDDKLYVPVTQLDRVQKYIGAEGADPSPASLKSGQWERTKRKAKKSTQLLARELMKLYAARERADGFEFSTDSPWLDELENSFRYVETDDQLQAIADTYRDMQQPAPMDRLICGDVGFGKTEVAIRASFKAVLDGKQVAVLAPTTVLAHQHFNTFRERLSRYPVEIGMLSRFISKQQQYRITQRLKEGTLDIVIGTHRLLGSDIDFKDLGLLVIDEEQRFGVKQKEKLKKFREGIDVLTLTATPIPRTLNMALSGIRRVSIINDPPQGRVPIRTFVRERDDDLIKEAITRELARGGQVYFVHNRVHSIPHVAAHVQRLVPHASVAVAHGQLPEDELQQVMLAFYAEEFDVLVSTTIIENGLDLPNVNTIIIDDADKLGLAQLYQLRGRVGRSNRQAYAYMLYRYPQRMTEDAEERLRAVEEFSELGSGFKLALRDLEIRGAGQILGAEQSGQMNAVGFDLYCQMLADAVKTLKGKEPSRTDDLPSIDIPVQTVIPANYMPSERHRIDFYRRLAAVESTDDLKQIGREMVDRHGKMPKPVKNLIRVAALKLKALSAGVADITTQNGKIAVQLSDRARLTQNDSRIIEGLYKPSQRQARKGARSALPRLTVRPTQIAFAHDTADKDALLAQLSQLLGMLTERMQQKRKRNAADNKAVNGAYV